MSFPNIKTGKYRLINLGWKIVIINNLKFMLSILGGREKVHIPEDKSFIFLRGNGKGKTAIVWSQSSINNRESATFSVEAPHFIAFGISFKVRFLELEVVSNRASSA